jgi:excisionase family DNA binding protein
MPLDRKRGFTVSAIENRGLLNIIDAANYLAVSSEWMRVRERAGEIPSVRLGRSMRFRVEDLDTYINEHLVEVE